MERREEGEKEGRGSCAVSGLSRRLRCVPVLRKEPNATRPPWDRQFS